MESDQNHISKVGIQKILELNCQKTTGMTDTHTILLFMGHITQASTIVELFPHFLAVFPPLEAQFQAFTPQPLAKRRAGGACDPARAAVRPCDCRASLQDPEQHGGGEPQEPLGSWWLCCGAGLTGAFYAGNGWVAGGCWDDYW